MATIKQIGDSLIKNGAVCVPDIRIMNVRVTISESRTLVWLDLDKEVPSFVEGENRVYERGVAKTICIPFGEIRKVFIADDDLSFGVNAISEAPKRLESILNRATVDIICEDVPAGTTYRNPYTEAEREKVSEYDSIYHHLGDIPKLHRRGLENLDKAIDDRINRL